MNTTFKTKRMKTLLIIGLALVISTTHSIGQTARTITLEEAISMSLQNSKQLKLSQTNVDMAGLNIRQIKENQSMLSHLQSFLSDPPRRMLFWGHGLP